MKRQAIYPMLIVVFASVAAMQTQAQTAESGVSEARLRRLVSPDGTENKAIQFKAGPIAKVQMRSVHLGNEVSPKSPQELRALIFENYAPAGAPATTLKAAAPQALRSMAGGAKLPSELQAEEAAKSTEATLPVRTLPTQGDLKEAQ